MSFQCSKCNKNLSTKFNLTRHQQTSKKCLNLNSKSRSDIVKKNYKCQYCEKELSSCQRLKYHTENACKKISNRITNNNIHNTINTTINNNNITIINIDSSHIGLLEYMTPQNIKKFQPSLAISNDPEKLALYTKEFLLGMSKPAYWSSDKKKQNFAYLDQDKNEKTDTNASILISSLSYYTPVTNVKDTLKSNEYISNLSQALPSSNEEREILAKIKENGERYIINKIYNELKNKYEEIDKSQVQKQFENYQIYQYTYSDKVKHNALKTLKNKKNEPYKDETITQLHKLLLENL